MKLHEFQTEFKDLITIVANKMHLPESAIERDYYIVMLLKNLADSEYSEKCVFKGGTSLSKCYPGSIERFSEDIDLTFLGIDESDKVCDKAIKRIEKIMTVGADTEKIDAERSNRSKSMYVWFGDKSNRIKLEIGSSVRPDPYSLNEPCIVVLVGPSGCGKSKIAKQFLKNTDRFEKLVSYTTKDPTAVETNEWYNYVDIDTFHEMVDSGKMFQSTMYAGHGYGSCKEDIEKILASGKHVMTTMDICGTMSLKTNFRNVVTVYIKREKKDLLNSILRKNSSVEDKVNRIIAIDAENKNAEI